MGNGSDNGNEFRDDTPNETPTATLEEHRPYVMTLANICGQLSSLNHNLERALHSLRVATEPVPKSFRDSLRDTFEGLEAVGAAGKNAFAK